jgi:hypothetical protein
MLLRSGFKNACKPGHDGEHPHWIEFSDFKKYDNIMLDKSIMKQSQSKCGAPLRKQSSCSLVRFVNQDHGVIHGMPMWRGG